MRAPLQAKPEQSKPEAARRPSVRESGAGVPLFLQAKLIGNHANLCPNCVTAEREEPGTAQPISIQPQAIDLLPDASSGIQRVLRAPCVPFDSSTQRFFESRFGRRLGNIRVHTDGEAQESARAIKAHASPCRRQSTHCVVMSFPS